VNYDEALKSGALGFPIILVQLSCQFKVKSCKDKTGFEEDQLAQPKISISHPELVELCKRWKITELALFGSVLSDDFRPDSDVDVLVTFDPDANWSLFDLVELKAELKTLFGREVDLVEREGIRNPFRRRSILSSLEVVYGSSGA
jgi:uncharacterized protein